VAGEFCEGYDKEYYCNKEPNAHRLFRKMKSSTPYGLLIRVSSHQAIPEAKVENDDRLMKSRRITGTSEGPLIIHPGFWIGLRMEPGDQPKFRAALKHYVEYMTDP